MADLTLEGCDRCCVDDYAALAVVVQRVGFSHTCGGLAGHIERADQIHANGFAEQVRLVVVPVTIHGFGCERDARATDANTFLPVNLACLREGDGDAFDVRNIHLAEQPADFFGNLFTTFRIHVEDRDANALVGQCAGRCFA